MATLLASAVQEESNFVKLVLFSPDGLCLLSASDDAILRLYDVPADALSRKEHGPSGAEAKELAAAAAAAEGGVEWRACLSSVAAESIHGAAWYPKMTSQDAQTCVFISSSRDCPIHMYDAFTGQLRASYRAYDHVDEIAAAVSLCFSAGGDKILGGYNNMVRIFDTARPGRDFQERPTSATRRSRDGQRGIVSALACCADGSGVYAAGTFARTICLYSSKTAGPLAALGGDFGSVTQVQFSPDGRLLLSGARKDNKILCWDLRKTEQPLMWFEREAATNQRIGFDVDPTSSHLTIGGSDGRVLQFDLKNGQTMESKVPQQSDCVGTVSVHPYTSLLALGTGQRHFPVEEEEEKTGCLSAVLLYQT